MRTLLVPLVLAALSTGCMQQIADHCTACTVVKNATSPQPAPEPRRLRVILVHGAFGFGVEWEPIVAEIRRQRDASFVVFEWKGPFRDLTSTVTNLAGVVQRALDEEPGAPDVLVLAHSAGGPIATRAALAARVPAGRRLKVVEIDSPTFINGKPFFQDKISADPPLPAGVEREVYVASSPPKKEKPNAPPRFYLGTKGKSVDHNDAVAMVGLPLLARLRAP